MAALMMCTSVILLLAGMIAGIVMGIQQNFLFAPAHAHLNLVGGVLLFLFGLYYMVVPKAADMTLAKVQGWLHIVGGMFFPFGIALALNNGHPFEFLAIFGALIVLTAMILFAVVVFRTARA
jgi:hypothetical protein